MTEGLSSAFQINAVEPNGDLDAVGAGATIEPALPAEEAQAENVAAGEPIAETPADELPIGEQQPDDAPDGGPDAARPAVENTPNDTPDEPQADVIPENASEAPPADEAPSEADVDQDLLADEGGEPVEQAVPSEPFDPHAAHRAGYESMLRA